MSPVRIQRQRAKGWKMPANTTYVGRPTIFGNPFPFDPKDLASRHAAVDAFRAVLVNSPTLDRHKALTFLRGNMGRGEGAITLMRLRIEILRGKNLACWCPLSSPCHADVLLEVANK